MLPSPHPALEDGEIAALVLVVDHEMDIREFAIPVCRVFGLTRVETEVACELAMGRTLDEIANLYNIKPETIRGYLKSIFSKTGVNRQVDLVRLILMSLIRAQD